MKKKVILVFLLTIVIGYSCQNEFIGNEKIFDKVLTRSLNEDISVNLIKQHFDAHCNILELPNFKENVKETTCAHEICTTHCHDATLPAMYSLFPDLKKNNIILEWNKSHTWSNEYTSYIEVPMNMGGQLYALKKEQKAGRIISHERSLVKCALVFQKKKDEKEILCYVTTIIGQKKNKQNRTKSVTYGTLEEIKFTGLVFISEVNGHMANGFRYEDGKIASKLKKTTRITDKSYITDVTLFDMSANRTTYNTDWENQCIACGQYHEAWEDCEFSDCDCGNPHCGCSVCHSVICQCCSNCGTYGNACSYCTMCKCLCSCCPNCHSNPCECYICKKCYKDPCICYK